MTTPTPNRQYVGATGPYARAQQVAPTQKIERQNYQGIILVEYIAAVLLTVATPVATKKGQQGLSPYMGKDIAKLAALTVLYLILAMLSVGGRGPGRMAAWFGGLILIVDGMYEANNLVKDVAALSGGLARAAGSAPTGSSDGSVPPGGFTGGAQFGGAVIGDVGIINSIFVRPPSTSGAFTGTSSATAPGSEARAQP